MRISVKLSYNPIFHLLETLRLHCAREEAASPVDGPIIHFWESGMTVEIAFGLLHWLNPEDIFIRGVRHHKSAVPVRLGSSVLGGLASVREWAVAFNMDFSVAVAYDFADTGLLLGWKDVLKYVLLIFDENFRRHFIAQNDLI